MKKTFLLLVFLLSINLFPQNWSLITTGITTDIWGIDYVDANTVWICGINGSSARSTNGGLNWTVGTGNAGEGAYSIAALSATTAVISLGPSAGDGKIMRTTDGGNTWTQVYTVAGAWFNFIDNLSSTNLWAQSDPIGGLFHILKSTDAGLTWTLTANRPTPVGTETGANGSFYRIGNTLWFGAGNGAHTYKSVLGVDGPWVMSTTTMNSPGTIAFSSTTGAGLSGHWSQTTLMNKTADGGATWTAQSHAIGTVNGLDYVQTTSFAWASTSTGIWFTSNNGTNWTQDQVATGMNVVKILVDVNVALAGGTVGKLYRSNRTAILPVELTSFVASANNGTVTLNWATATEINNRGFQIERKSANSEYVTVAFVEGYGSTTQPQHYTYSENLASGTYTYRLKQVDFDGTSTYSNAVEVDVVAPDQYSLGQNYPNPFNPSTRINFTVVNPGLVKLAVYNLLGQEVKSIVNEFKEAGTYNVSFDGSDLSSGAYFYKIETAQFSKTMKMLLTK